MIISIDAEKSFDKIQDLLMIETLSKMDIEGTFLNTLGTINEKPEKIIFNGEKV